MDEYVCLTVKSRSGEPPDEFNKRLIGFWSHMLRDRKSDYEQVYAETTKFVPAGNRVTRQYMLAIGTAGVVEAELGAAGVEYDPIDLDDVYSKYEAAPPDWFQIPH